MMIEKRLKDLKMVIKKIMPHTSFITLVIPNLTTCHLISRYNKGS